MSFSSKITPRRRTYVRLMGQIYHALNAALAEEADRNGLTQKRIAEILGKSKSRVSRLFSGQSNMTLETLADLAYALDRSVEVSLPSRVVGHGSNESLPRTGAANLTIVPPGATPQSPPPTPTKPAPAKVTYA